MDQTRQNTKNSYCETQVCLDYVYLAIGSGIASLLRKYYFTILTYLLLNKNVYFVQYNWRHYIHGKFIC